MARGKIIEIVSNPALKRDGSPLVNKPGQKQWSMSRVKAELDNGTTQEGNVFNPVQVGESIEAEFNEQYSSWNFSKVKPPKQVSEQEALMINMLKDFGVKIDAIYKAVVGEVKDVTGATDNEDKIAQEAADSLDEEIDLSTIPF